MHTPHNATLTAVALTLLTTVALADHHIKVGDTVEANWAGWKPAKVLKVKDNGWVQVRVKMKGGRTMTPLLPPDKVRKRDKDGNVVENPGPKYKPAQRVEVFRDKKWWPGDVVERIGNGSYRVKIDKNGDRRTLLFKPAEIRAVGEHKPDPENHRRKQNRVRSEEVRDWKLKDGTPLPRASVENYIAAFRRVMLKREKDNVTRFYEIDALHPDDRAYVLALAKEHGVEDRPIVPRPEPDFRNTFEGRVAPPPSELGAG